MNHASTLVLFDIDGTLVLTGGAGSRAMTRAFEAVFAVADAFRGAPMAGRTDSWILSDALATRGIVPLASDVARFRDAYLSFLGDELRTFGTHRGIMPGVRELLDTLAGKDDMYLALLTGNYEAGARAKLEHFDLWRYFECGAFGDDAPERNRLLPKALAVVAERRGRAYGPHETVVIGDTPLDVACASAGGARSIAVATGSYTVEQLKQAGADVALQDLARTEEVLRALSWRKRLGVEPSLPT